MRRRDFMALAGSAALLPLGAQAQQRPRLIGYIHTSVVIERHRRALERGLHDAGFSEGQNLTILYRFAEGRADRLPDLAKELVQRGVEVIVTSGGSISAQAAKAVTTTVPIVFMMGDADPVQAGLVASLGRPAGNLTGITILGGALGPKRVEILREIAPHAKTIAVLLNPQNRNSEPHGREVEAAIRAVGQEAVMLPAAGAEDFDNAFARLVEGKADALIVTADNVYTRVAPQLIALAARHRIPAIYQWRDFVDAGGLISYGASLSDINHQLGLYTGRVLKGDKPADLPIQQPIKFELVINLKTAKTLGLAVPPTLVARADDVVE
jgi:putative tryptophan/tyrosine transport system substrate-binding protein